MQSDIRIHDCEPQLALRRHAERRLRLRLSRFSTKLTRVSLRIGDENGPKGGVDRSCRLIARGPTVGVLSIEERSSDAFVAVDLGLERLARALGRALERSRPLTVELRPRRRAL